MHIALPANKATGLEVPCWVQVDQLATVRRSRVRSPIGELDRATLRDESGDPIVSRPTGPLRRAGLAERVEQAPSAFGVDDHLAGSAAMADVCRLLFLR